MCATTKQHLMAMFPMCKSFPLEGFDRWHKGNLAVEFFVEFDAPSLVDVQGADLPFFSEEGDFDGNPARMGAEDLFELEDVAQARHIGVELDFEPLKTFFLRLRFFRR